MLAVLDSDLSSVEPSMTHGIPTAKNLKQRVFEMKTYFWISLISTITMFLSGTAVLRKIELLSVQAFGLFTITAILSWVFEFLKSTIDGEKEKYWPQLEKLNKAFGD